MRVLLLGDSHMDLDHWRFACDTAKRNDCARICQLGDFGYWPHIATGQAFLQGVAKLLAHHDIEAWFLSGNHENFDLLLPQGRWDLLDASQPQQIDEHLFHLPRGFVWEWDGVSFMALGGAASIDKDHRLMIENQTTAPRTQWWPQEAISEADLHRIANPGPIDIMLTHDAPFEIDLAGLDLEVPGKDPHPPSVANRRRVSSVMHRCEPKMLVHGHLHVQYRQPVRHIGGVTQIYGLDCNHRPSQSVLALDLDAFKRKWRPK